MAVTGASGTGWWERMVGVKSQWRSHVNWDRYSILSSQKSFAKSQYGGLHEWNLQAHLLIISWISNLIPIIISIVHLLFENTKLLKKKKVVGKIEVIIIYLNQMIDTKHSFCVCNVNSFKVHISNLIVLSTLKSRYCSINYKREREIWDLEYVKYVDQEKPEVGLRPSLSDSDTPGYFSVLFCGFLFCKMYNIGEEG